MDALIVAIEAGRWGPARLPRAMRGAGLTVAALCPSDNAVASTDFLDKHYVLPITRSSRKMEIALAAAMRDCRPRLIVPADEQVVALLQAFVRRGPGVLGHADLKTIEQSLGRPDRFDAMLMKSDTLALARTLDIRVPSGATVTSLENAVAVANEIGFPVYIKQSFGWAGRAVARCEGPAALAAAIPQAKGRLAPIKSTLRRWLARDWYPSSSTVDVQKEVRGTPAMYSAVAWQGKMLAGFAGVRRDAVEAETPSTTVWLGAHAEMAAAADRLIAAFGATGFITFDFMLEKTSGAPFLLECNPRPNQVCHLGDRIGADLAVSLAKALAAEIPSGAAIAPDREVEVVLFPHATRRSGVPGEAILDIPWDDKGLRHFASPGSEAPHSRFATPRKSRISPISG